ncbi:MAG: hypothetical protein K5857_09765 [Lachnospiraceae bacterium]|nr:hypothetical protein [Lachnospiraceae bacterium]
MTVDAYLNPDFTSREKLIFLSLAFAGILLCVFAILGGVRLSTLGMKKKARRRAIYERSHNRVQRFYEMIISATSVMTFSCSYVIINHIYSVLQGEVGSAEYEKFSAFVSIWEGGKDFVLLLLICLSCVLNSILDKLFIPLKKIDKTEKATVRMLGMFYVIFILVYLNNIGDASEYNPVVLYYLGLMVGRFVYFDASFMDFLEALKNMVKNTYLLILGLLLTGLLCYFGFSKGYLLERNYYIVGAFYTHLFMLAAVFVLHHSHILHLIVRKPKGYKAEADEPAPEDDEYTEYEDDAYGDETYEEYDNYEEYEYEDENGIEYYNLEEYGDDYAD